MSPKAENKMGKWGAVSYLVGIIMGSGIFITPTVILNNVNSIGASLAVWVLSAVIATMGGFCYVELGTSIRRSGSDYAYLCYVRWKLIAFMFMATTAIFTNSAIMAVQLETFSVYIIQGLNIQMCNQTLLHICQKLIGFSLLGILLFINFFSIRRVVARFQMAAMFAKFFAAGIIVLIGMYMLIFSGNTQNFVDPFANTTLDPARVTNAFFAGLFSYDGWDILNYGVEEVINPGRVMPFAILLGIGIVMTIYTSINFAYFSVLSVPEFQRSNAVAISFAAKTMGPFQGLMPFLVCLVLVGAINGTIFINSRYLLAAARQRQFPTFIGCVNDKHGSPRAALISTLILTITISFLGNLEQLISYVGFIYWFQRTLAILALLYIRFWKLPVHENAVKMPLILSIAFFIICASLIIITLVKDFATTSIGLTFLFAGFIIYLIFVRESGWSLQRFECYRNGVESINKKLCILAQATLDGIVEVVDTEEKSTRKNTFELRPNKVGDLSFPE